NPNAVRINFTIYHLHKIFYALLMPFVSHTSLSEDSIAQIIIIIISLFSAGILTRKLFGPITFNQDN
ncbi:hypothetical protein, partial [Companilactobacillus bobalius]|uniref:hypothetical protein n=1 Tax=Companilactobacillus bobalius TaxID=2801451 RepID=UPI001F261646